MSKLLQIHLRTNFLIFKKLFFLPMSYVNREQIWLIEQRFIGWSLSYQNWFCFISISLLQAVVSLHGKGAAGVGRVLVPQLPATSTTLWEWLWPFEEQPGATFSVVQVATFNRHKPGSLLQARNTQAHLPQKTDLKKKSGTLSVCQIKSGLYRVSIWFLFILQNNFSQYSFQIQASEQQIRDHQVLLAAVFPAAVLSH